MNTSALDHDHATVEALRQRLVSALSDEIQIRGWTQDAAAINLGLSQPDISTIHHGQIQRLSLSTLVAAAAKLQILVVVNAPALGRTYAESGDQVREYLMGAVVDEMRERNWSLEEAARHLGTNMQRISDIRSHRHSRISVDSMVEIAAQLGITVSCSRSGIGLAFNEQWLHLSRWMTGLPDVTTAQAEELLDARKHSPTARAHAAAKEAVEKAGPERQRQVLSARAQAEASVRLDRPDIGLLKVVRSAAGDVATALALRDLVDQPGSGFGQQDYDAMTADWRMIFGPIHPSDGDPRRQVTTP